MNGTCSLKDFYRSYMRFAERIGLFIRRLVFSVLFIVVIPPFWIISLVISLKDRGKESFWIKKESPDLDGNYFERMG